MSQTLNTQVHYLIINKKKDPMHKTFHFHTWSGSDVDNYFYYRFEVRYQNLVVKRGKNIKAPSQ